MRNQGDTNAEGVTDWEIPCQVDTTHVHLLSSTLFLVPLHQEAQRPSLLPAVFLRAGAQGTHGLDKPSELLSELHCSLY